MTPIPYGLPNPPYLFAAVNEDYEETGVTEVFRLVVLPEYPTDQKLKEMREAVEEDKSVVDPFVIIEGTDDMYDQFQQEIHYVYRKIIH